MKLSVPMDAGFERAVEARRITGTPLVIHRMVYGLIAVSDTSWTVTHAPTRYGLIHAIGSRSRISREIKQWFDTLPARWQEVMRTDNVDRVRSLARRHVRKLRAIELGLEKTP